MIDLTGFLYSEEYYKFDVIWGFLPLHRFETNHIDINLSFSDVTEWNVAGFSYACYDYCTVGIYMVMDGLDALSRLTE